MEMNDQEIADYTRRLRGHVEFLMEKRGFAKLEWGFADLVVIIAQVQLALRHPQNTGEAAKGARKLTEQLIAGLDKASPGIGTLLEIGFDADGVLPIRPGS